MSVLRKFARRHLTTVNTLRYQVEWPRLQGLGEKIGTVDTLFDGGAGSGEFSKRFLETGFCKKVIAFEPMTGNFERLEENYSRMKDQVDLQNKGIIEIDLESASVDAVTCNQVLEHIEPHDKVVAEFSRILKPGGHAIISVPQPPAPWPEGDHVREGYTDESLTELMADAGFEAVAFDWFLTKRTTDKILGVQKLPMRGRYVPSRLFAEEVKWTLEQRRDGIPYGIAGLFRKV